MLSPVLPFLAEDADESLPIQAALEAAAREGLTLSEFFAQSGFGYSDLQYTHSRRLVLKTGSPPCLADFSRRDSGIPFVSFFTGCGGIDLGFEAAGFTHVAGFEHNELFCKTLRKNRSHWSIFGPPYHSGDVSSFGDIDAALHSLAGKPFEGVFVGGPPCQPFSIAANQRFSKAGAHFKRTGFKHEKNGNLLLSYIDLILDYRPAVFVIENVPGLRDLDSGEQLSSAIKLLEAQGYKVAEPFVLDSAHFQVPQQRTRLFVVGSRLGRDYCRPSRSALTFGAGSVLGRIPAYVRNTEIRDHKASSVLRYMQLNYGERDQLGRVDRLDPRRPSKTVIAGGVNGGGRSHLHPEIPRTLSVRECARLQTFPDDYTFVGPTARQFTQVGNAVPPVLAAQIATSIAKSLFRS